MLTAVIHTLLSAGKHMIDVDQGEHDERPDQRAGLNGDATPQQSRVSRLVQQCPNDHLHIREGASKNDPGQDLQRGQKAV